MKSEQFGGKSMAALQRMMGKVDHTVMTHSTACWEALICVLAGTKIYKGWGRTARWLRKHQLEANKLRYEFSLWHLTSCELIKFSESVSSSVKWGHNNIYFLGRNTASKESCDVEDATIVFSYISI